MKAVTWHGKRDVRVEEVPTRRWVSEILPLLTDGDPLGVDTFHTNIVPLDEAPEMYKLFQDKTDGVVKVLLKP